MSPRPDRRLVAARGVAAAGMATFAATVGHATAQHALPSGWVVVVAFAVAAPVCVALAGRRLSIVRLAAAVAASQAAFHLLLRLDFTGASQAPPVGHRHGAVVGAVTTDAAAAAHGLTPAMLVGHALAALATVVVLATGERAARALLALALRPFRALAAPTARVPVVPSLPVAGPPVLRPVLVPGAPVGRRGPPFPA